MTKKILLCGTPGTGKSYIVGLVASSLGEHRSLKIINTSDLVCEEKIYSRLDEHMDSFIIEERKLKKRLKGLIKEVTSDILIIESHSVDSIPRNMIDRIIVLKTSTDIHFDRLKLRGYSNPKIQENIDCEIMQVVYEDVINRFPNIPIHIFNNHTHDDALKVVEYVISLFVSKN
jgi:adenylate kinase